MPVRIFTYRVGGDATTGAGMKDMACTNKGELSWFFFLTSHVLFIECQPKIIMLFTYILYFSKLTNYIKLGLVPSVASQQNMEIDIYC